MESTPFEKGYEKQIHPDDSIKLVFREGRIEDRRIAMMVSLMMVYLLGLLGAWLLLSLGLLWMLGEQYLGAAGLTGFLAVWAGVLYWRKRVLGLPAVIRIKRDGLILFGRQQLAFKDVSGFGLHTETGAEQFYVQILSGRTFAENSYVYALMGGCEIRLTRHMRKPLAQALLREVEDEALAWANRGPEPPRRSWDPVFPPREADAAAEDNNIVRFVSWEDKHTLLGVRNTDGTKDGTLSGST